VYIKAGNRQHSNRFLRLDCETKIKTIYTSILHLIIFWSKGGIGGKGEKEVFKVISGLMAVG
jgi:predicted metallopeptidase